MMPCPFIVGFQCKVDESRALGVDSWCMGCPYLSKIERKMAHVRYMRDTGHDVTRLLEGI